MVGFNSHLVHVKLLDGEPLSDGDFIVKLTAEEVGLIAYGLMLQSRSSELPPDAWARKPSEELSYKFADLVGIH